LAKTQSIGIAYYLGAWIIPFGQSCLFL